VAGRKVTSFPSGDIYAAYVADPHRTGNGAMALFYTRTEIPDTSGTFDSQNSLDNIGWDGNYGLTLTTASASRLAYKLAVLHCSSHVGDEYIERTGRGRFGYSREELALGARYRIGPAWSAYAELGLAYKQLDDLQEPWRVQLGAEWQAERTQILGRFAWYGALDLQLWQERSFEPDVTIQGGLAAAGANRTWRFGVEYSHGRPPLGEFFQDTEARVTLGMWVDF
jgi:hypothetical protein